MLLPDTTLTLFLYRYRLSQAFSQLYSNFMNEETGPEKVKKFVQGHLAHKWLSQDLNLDLHHPSHHKLLLLNSFSNTPYSVFII